MCGHEDLMISWFPGQSQPHLFLALRAKQEESGICIRADVICGIIQPK